MRLQGKKTFLVTGHRGFIGSHFTELILSKGHRVIGIDKLTYAANRSLVFQGDFFEILPKQSGPLPPSVQYPCGVEGCRIAASTMIADRPLCGTHAIDSSIWPEPNLGDISFLQDLPHCDVIVNFAAESHVDNSISGNDVFLTSNVMGVHRMLELIKNRKIENLMHSWAYEPPLFVQISTDEVFGDIEEGFFHPDDRHMPSNPYSATKSAAEMLVMAWGRTYGLPYIITRTTNNYGPRQHPEKLIPRTIMNLVMGKKAVVHGSGSYIRNWIHVQDNVSALYAIIDGGEQGRAYHVSSEEELSVKQVVERVCQRLGLTYNDVVDCSTDRSGADVRYALACDETRALGWRPKRSFDEALDELIVSMSKELAR